MSFVFKKTEISGNTHIQCSGALDENAKLPDNSATFHGDLILKMADVNLINSMGCRNWVNWIKSLKAQGLIKLVECSPAVIGQANVLTGFLPSNVTVDSFSVPYSCLKCGDVQLKLFNSKDVIKNGKVTVEEEIPCAKCGGTRSMDVVAQKYFIFLRK